MILFLVSFSPLSRRMMSIPVRLSGERYFLAIYTVASMRGMTRAVVCGKMVLRVR